MEHVLRCDPNGRWYVLTRVAYSYDETNRVYAKDLATALEYFRIITSSGWCPPTDDDDDRYELEVA